MLASAGVVAKLTVLHRSGPHHVLVAPDSLGSFARRPQLEHQMNAAQLKAEVISRSAGQASHVISAVYENRAGIVGSAPPEIILFIGGKLSGVSPGAFITSFTQQFKGAHAVSPGSLGGSAACVDAQSSAAGNVALCTWADNDTFGVVASPTLDVTDLATQMRTIRPGVEHRAP